MEKSLELLVEEMFTLTVELQEKVASFDMEEEEEDDSIEWVNLLEQRQSVIDDMELLLQQGQTFSALHKEKLKQIHEIDQQISPLLSDNQKKIQQKIAQLNKSKIANQQYNGGYGGYQTAYGAFLDKKN